MGTRSAWGFIADGVEKINYCQFDGYPEGKGADVLSLVKSAEKAKLKEAARQIKLVSVDDTPSPEDVEYYQGISFDKNVSDGSTSDWYCLLRQAQDDLSLYVADKPIIHMIDSSDFLYDSLFCEWAYIINFDSGKVEIYKGFNRDENAPGRYSKIPKEIEDSQNTSNDCKGVALLGEISIDDIVSASDDDIDKICRAINNIVYQNDEDFEEDELEPIDERIMRLIERPQEKA